jgi:hypothetical protein
MSEEVEHSTPNPDAEGSNPAPVAGSFQVEAAAAFLTSKNIKRLRTEAGFMKPLTAVSYAFL